MCTMTTCKTQYALFILVFTYWCPTGCLAQMLFTSTGDTSEAGIAYPTLPPEHMGSPHPPVVCGVVRVAQSLASV